MTPSSLAAAASAVPLYMVAVRPSVRLDAERRDLSRKTEVQDLLVGIDQHLNEQVPLDLVFRDDVGQAVKLGDYFGKKPVILALVYYECPMLCTLTLNVRIAPGM